MIRKDIEKQKTLSSLQAPGKENRPPKLNLKNEWVDVKRSSVPRADTKLKLGFKKQSSMSKKALRNKKVNNSKIYQK